MNEAATKRLEESGIGADFDAAERTEIARKVGLAALKFADLQNQRLTNYIFDPERFTAFEGKTGPYLLYAVVRIKSILRKAETQGAKAGDIVVSQPAEEQLVLALDAFGRAVATSAEKYSPHIFAIISIKSRRPFLGFTRSAPSLLMTRRTTLERHAWP